MTIKNPRALAAIVLTKLSHKNIALTECLAEVIPQKSEGALLQAICYGVSRHAVRLHFLLSKLLSKPLKAADADIYWLLIIGLYQILYMHVPVHAAVAETVNAVRELNKNWAAKLVNGILRNFIRRQQTLLDLITDEAIIHSCPDWLYDELKSAWPDDWQTLLAENNAHPPFSIRINLTKISRADYQRRLLADGHAAEIIPYCEAGLILQKPVNVHDLPGFSEGLCSVQDGAAQLAAALLMLAPQLDVLDACAAPGGKLTHILELEPNLASVTALEKSPKRLALIKENLARLQLKAELICADAADLSAWHEPNKLYDRILLDAPCSATGVIRRHPDIKLLRRAGDIAPYAATQLALLNALWPTLKSGGILLYATCSVLPEENVRVLQQFMANHADAAELKIDIALGHALEIGRQILPGEQHMDGFYYARVGKVKL